MKDTVLSVILAVVPFLLKNEPIPAVIPVGEQGPFRNRKGFLSQNVLAVVNFDMTFSYCLAGWEGSAHDSQV
jgi:hypothetical protein